MELIFVGTGSGKTSKERFHSSLLFKSSSNNILIDTGDSISRALLAQNISVNSITNVIYTHYHSDHLAGLPSLLTQMIIGNRKEPLTIYTHKDLLQPLHEFIKISFLFIETFQFEIKFVGFDFEKSCQINDEFTFLAKQNSHIRNRHNLTNTNIQFISSSFLFKMNKQNIVYTSDIGKIDDTITILNPERIFLTHIEKEEELNNWLSNLSEKLRGKITLANDGMQLEL